MTGVVRLTNQKAIFAKVLCQHFHCSFSRHLQLTYKLRQTIIGFLALVELFAVSPFVALVALVGLVAWLPS